MAGQSCNDENKFFLARKKRLIGKLDQLQCDQMARLFFKFGHFLQWKFSYYREFLPEWVQTDAKY